MVRYAIRVAGEEIVVDAPFRAGDALLATGAQARVALPARAAVFLGR